ncbi:DUF4296 domain-containing protein [Sunxiuqinia dokdonensis]|uniref:DUF4296 domain-containing protein n=1 Tax=Sunxiuqinia dokdonensis TaxID=1409788 RepID=A0A0L8V4X2_9BACT|nr:DUF4296 domain-containing protein [Sunxiuqinia dokdonensis]KOH43232.1 hypothetical protein NC99_39630 [Sunxiuqinia dokdonensis]
MKRTTHYFLLILLAVASFSCKEKKGFPKPDNLIKEKQMVDMLYDMHLNEAYANQYRFDKEIAKLESKDLYYSVLEKHGVADSVFAQSVVYYSSLPKVYERIYQQVVDRLNMLQEEANEKKEVNIQPEK